MNAGIAKRCVALAVLACVVGVFWFRTGAEGDVDLAGASAAESTATNAGQDPSEYPEMRTVADPVGEHVGQVQTVSGATSLEPTLVAGARSGDAGMLDSGILVVDSRDRAPLPWWDVKVEFDEGDSLMCLPDRTGYVAFGSRRAVRSVRIRASEGHASGWAVCELAKSENGGVLALAPCAFVGRVLFIGSGSSVQKARVSSIKLRITRDMVNSIAGPMPVLAPCEDPEERAILIPRTAQGAFDLSEIASQALVSIEGGGPAQSQWLANFDLPRTISSDAVIPAMSPAAGMIVRVLNQTDGATITGAIVRIDGPAHQASSQSRTISVTGDDGSARFGSLEAGEYVVHVNAIGFEATLEWVDVLDVTATVDVVLTPSQRLCNLKVQLKCPRDIDPDRFRVVARNIKVDILRELDPELKSDESECTLECEFMQLPPGGYEVSVLEMTQPTRTIDSKHVTLPSEVDCTFDLLTAEPNCELLLDIAGSDVIAIDVWARSETTFRTVLQAAKPPRITLEIPPLSDESAWIVQSEGFVPCVVKSDDLTRSAGAGRKYRATIELERGWGAVLRVTDKSGVRLSAGSIRFGDASELPAFEVDSEGLILVRFDEKPSNFPVTFSVYERGTKLGTATLGQKPFQRVVWHP